jgi:hypothetical protein
MQVLRRGGGSVHHLSDSPARSSPRRSKNYSTNLTTEGPACEGDPKQIHWAGCRRAGGVFRLSERIELAPGSRQDGRAEVGWILARGATASTIPRTSWSASSRLPQGRRDFCGFGYKRSAFLL